MSRYKAYGEYKDSGVEWLRAVPSHWKVVPLKRVCVLKTGLTPPTDNQENYVDEETEFPWVRPEDLNENGIAVNATKYLSSTGWQSMRKISPYSTLICCIGTIGKVGYVENVVATNQQITAASFSYSPKYNFYLIQSARNILEETATGNVIQILNSERLSGVKFLSITCTEADTIANFLDHETAKIDTLIAKQQGLIKLLKEKRQAVISHAVTKGLNPNAPMRDPGLEWWLGEVPAHWVRKIKLSNVAESNRGSFVNGPFGSDLLASELIDVGVPVIYIRDLKRTGYKRKSTVCVTEVKAKQLEVCKVQSGDVLISKVGDPPGDACIYPEREPDAIITQDVIRIRVDQNIVNPLFLTMLLNSDFSQTLINDISVEGTRKRVSLGDFKSIRFIFPSMQEQIEIVRYVDAFCEKVDDLIAKSYGAIGLIIERRTALISAAVTGKIDVRDWQPVHSDPLAEPALHCETNGT